MKVKFCKRVEERTEGGAGEMSASLMRLLTSFHATSVCVSGWRIIERHLLRALMGALSWITRLAGL